MTRLLITLVLGLLLTACGPSESDKPEPLSPGAQLVKANCKVCHASGINGAPILGNPKMWGPRLTQGKAVLVQHAIEGYGLMPAKGGRENLTDEEIELAVGHMLSLLETE